MPLGGLGTLKLSVGLAGESGRCYLLFEMSNALRDPEHPFGARSPSSTAKDLQRKPVELVPLNPPAGVGFLASESAPGPTRRKMVELSAFFERLRQCLDDRSMSQADLARELGVGVATVSEWFTRGRVPSGDVMLRLPQVLRVNGHWLLTGEGSRALKRRRGEDPYQRGAQDAIARMTHCLEDVAHRFGLEIVASRRIAPAETDAPPAPEAAPPQR